MTRDIQGVVDQLRELLPYVARDAERYRNPTELVTKSHELHLAARAIEETLPHPSLASTARGPFIRVRIGANAVKAYGFRKLPYDFLETYPDKAESGEEYDLRTMRRIQTDIFNPRHTQPVFGQLRYFDLATIGRTLEEGGELSVSESETSRDATQSGE